MIRAQKPVTLSIRISNLIKSIEKMDGDLVKLFETVPTYQFIFLI